MIRLKVFISSVQKELRAERIAVGSSPAPLLPNSRAYLDLLGTCHVYLLVVGRTYGPTLDDGLSATHHEYRLAQERKLPTLVCVKGERAAIREPEVKAGHAYSRFASIEELLERVRQRLTEYIQRAFDTSPSAVRDLNDLVSRGLLERTGIGARERNTSLAGGSSNRPLPADPHLTKFPANATPS